MQICNLGTTFNYKVNVNKKKKEMFGTKAEGGEKESQLPPESEPTLVEDWSFQLTSGLPGPRCSNLWERRRARIFIVAHVVACVRPSQERRRKAFLVHSEPPPQKLKPAGLGRPRCLLAP